MAAKKNNGKSVAAPVMTAAEELEALRKRMAELKDTAKAEREEAAEKDKAEREAKREDARDTATAAVRSWLDLSKSAKGRESADYGKSLSDAIESLREYAGTYRIKGSGKGRGTPRNPERLNLTQKRILAYLLTKGKDEAGTRVALCAAGTGRKDGTLSGAYIGNADETTRDPYSLWGRKLIEGEEVETDGGKVTQFSLTAEGRVKAKEAKKDLEEAEAANGAE
jgi:hypothetical protein